VKLRFFKRQHRFRDLQWQRRDQDCPASVCQRLRRLNQALVAQSTVTLLEFPAATAGTWIIAAGADSITFQSDQYRCPNPARRSHGAEAF